jgi:hypothetical protein
MTASFQVVLQLQPCWHRTHAVAQVNYLLKLMLLLALELRQQLQILRDQHDVRKLRALAALHLLLLEFRPNFESLLIHLGQNHDPGHHHHE